jgi:hypothetical protein
VLGVHPGAYLFLTLLLFLLFALSFLLPLLFSKLSVNIVKL